MMTHAEIAAIMRHGPEEYRLAVRWQYPTGTPGFVDLLLRAIAHADDDNRALLARVFPDACLAVTRWQREDGYEFRMRVHARGLLAAEGVPYTEATP